MLRMTAACMFISGNSGQFKQLRQSQAAQAFCPHRALVLVIEKSVLNESKRKPQLPSVILTEMKSMIANRKPMPNCSLLVQRKTLSIALPNKIQ